MDLKVVGERAGHCALRVGAGALIPSRVPSVWLQRSDEEEKATAL